MYIARILQQVLASSQNTKGFLKFSTFISGLLPNLAKSSCEWSPVGLHKKKLGGKKKKACKQASFMLGKPTIVNAATSVQIQRKHQIDTKATQRCCSTKMMKSGILFYF